MRAICSTEATRQQSKAKQPTELGLEVLAICTCRVIPSNACVTPLRASLGSESGHLDQRKYTNPTARRFFAADIVGHQTTQNRCPWLAKWDRKTLPTMANYRQLKIVITAALLAAAVGKTHQRLRLGRR